MSKLYLAVDPGKKGAIAARTPTGNVYLANYSTTADMVDHIQHWQTMSSIGDGDTEVIAYVESVHSSPQAGPKQSFSFGQNFGEWLGIFAALKTQVRLVKPQEWQRMIPNRSGKSGAELKRVLKAHAQRLYPSYTVTLTNADALLILDHALNS